MSGGSGRGKLFAFLQSTSSRNELAPATPSLPNIKQNTEASTSADLSETRSATNTPAVGRGRLFADSAINSGLLNRLNKLTVDKSSDLGSSIDLASSEYVSNLSTSSKSSEAIEPVKQFGSHGIDIQVAANYIRILSSSDNGVFEYQVNYTPNLHSSAVRHRLLNQHRDQIGNTKTFDGETLFLPIKLPKEETHLISTNDNDNTKIKLTVIYKRKKKMSECIQFYNVLFKQIMKALEYVQFGKKLFDPTRPKLIPQHRLTIWPGYVTAVDEYHGGLMLLLDVSHRVLCDTTVMDLLRQIYISCKQNPSQNLMDTVKASLLNTVVLTKYNNKSYRIDDVDFSVNPMSTFKSKNGDVSYMDYYKSHYGIDIKDLKQPLLISHRDRKCSQTGNVEQLTFCLIPELSHLTGITDDLRKNYKVMTDIATHTRITPNQRMLSMQKFLQNVNETPKAKEILACWGLALGNEPINFNARQLDTEKISMGHNKEFPVGSSSDFSKAATTNTLYDVINLTDWLLIYTNKEARIAKSFVVCLKQCTTQMGMMVSMPRQIPLDDDRTETYAKLLRKELRASTQIVVVICPTSRDDRYATIKKICCTELPIASQVINSNTIKNETKMRSIVQKIALQMNCKLGGSLWTINLPFKNNIMLCGIDTYHDSSGKMNSVAAFVASLNNSCTRWYSKATIQKPREELMHGLTVSLENALNVYQRNGIDLPDRIIVYRDGVSDGQFNICQQFEVPQLKQACRLIHPDYNPPITFIVVQKRNNTRIFRVTADNKYENPKSGCVVDHTITRRSLYDFFLIPRDVRYGTVSPTHLVVLMDEFNFKPDILQRLSYKLCFMYYNWTGAISVPACCQYAHKMAFLVGQSIGKETSDKLCERLFYL